MSFIRSVWNDQSVLFGMASDEHIVGSSLLSYHLRGAILQRAADAFLESSI
jgi:hypothetical protein